MHDTVHQILDKCLLVIEMKPVIQFLSAGDEKSHNRCDPRRIQGTAAES